jgi:hypothetical protein
MGERGRCRFIWNQYLEFGISDFLHSLVFFHIVQEFSDALFQNGMDKTPVNFSQRNENELALLEKRMWDLQLLRSDFLFIIKEDIKINGSGSPAEGLLSAQLRFDPLQDSEQLKRFQLCLDFYNPVDEPILRSMTQGFCFEK